MINRFIAATAISILSLSLSLPGIAKPLQAGISEEEYRITKDEQPEKPKTDKLTDEQKRIPLRISRDAVNDEKTAGTAEAAKTAPTEPLSGGLVDTHEFDPKNFDIGAEHNSREMVLAWERWHHQLTQAMYSRWRALNHFPGHATMRITVTRDLRIKAETLKNDGSAEFEATILQAIGSLDNNPGLTFPAKSERQVVSFDCNMTAGHVSAGYTWDKRDFEKIRKDD